MRKRDAAAILFSAALLAVAIYALFFAQKPALPTPAAPVTSVNVAEPAAAPRLAHATQSLKVPTVPYDFAQIQAWAHRSRVQLADCMTAEKNLKVSEIRLQLRWSPRAELESLNSSVPLHEQTRACLDETVRTWRLPLHPRAQPIEYSLKLRI